MRRPTCMRVVAELQIRDHDGDRVDDGDDHGEWRVGDDLSVATDKKSGGLRNEADDERDVELVRRRPWHDHFGLPRCAGLERRTFHEPKCCYVTTADRG